MKKTIILGLLVLFALAGCSQTAENHMHSAEEFAYMQDCREDSTLEQCDYYLEHADHHGIKSTDETFMSMNDMPCHQMPDGSWMGDCEADVTDAPWMRMHQTAGLVPGQKGTQYPPAKSTSIVDVEDGETFALSADIVQKEINGKPYTMYGYNSRIPGPAIRAQKDSTITVDFTNNIDMPTTVHWHGLRHDIEFDGVPGVSQDPVLPGESFSYTLTFPDDGIFWYHPHIREDIQQDAGLAGNILVLPDAAYNPVNQEELLILDDLLMQNGELVPWGEKHADFAVMGRFGNIMLTNGETDYNLDATVGVTRLYITNVANVRPFNISIPGATMKLVGGDLGQYEREEFVDSVIIAPAQRVFVDVLFEEEGKYDILHVNPHRTYKMGTVIVLGTAGDYSGEFYNNRENPAVIADIQSFSEYFDKKPDYEITLDIEMMGMMMQGMPCHQMPDGSWMGDCEDPEHQPAAIEWEDEMQMRMSAGMLEWILRDENGNENADIVMQANVGDVVKIRLFNDPDSMHPMQHPIHLHGQRFVVTQIDGENVENKVWADTVLVPVGSTVDILVDVTNPGEWMMHCHIAEHLEAGMMTSFVVS